MYSLRLQELQRQRLLRAAKDRDLSRGSRIVIEGREYVNFASNDYLGLSGDPALVAAAKEAMEEFGFGSGASRLLSGGTRLHRKLEEEVARFKGAEAALVFNSGYAANCGAIPSLASAQDIIFSDELNHASIVEGCRLSRARTVVYRHGDMSHLESLLKHEAERSPGGGRSIFVTDTVFSMDGDIAPLRALWELCGRHDGLLYIDDAHATGVIGSGKGALSHFGISPTPRIIQMGTFSKALGSYGAFVAGSREVIDWLTSTARTFMFSTALPACVVAASLKALGMIGAGHDSLRGLWTNHRRLLQGLSEIGGEISSETPIIPLKIGGVGETLAASQQLSEKGLYVPAIRPPTVKEPRLRITVTASHTDEDIDRLVEALKELL
ncbi:MAG TPA: 8-amino-7-oxononanoate synthase [Thermodesulfovibrionales bacterium]|nr:8-amino-7-oxononanoate synthase [Thermodesulfovibrionales bacterium]